MFKPSLLVVVVSLYLAATSDAASSFPLRSYPGTPDAFTKRQQLALAFNRAAAPPPAQCNSQCAAAQHAVNTCTNDICLCTPSNIGSLRTCFQCIADVKNNLDQEQTALSKTVSDCQNQGFNVPTPAPLTAAPARPQSSSPGASPPPTSPQPTATSPGGSSPAGGNGGGKPSPSSSKGRTSTGKGSGEPSAGLPTGSNVGSATLSGPSSPPVISPSGGPGPISISSIPSSLNGSVPTSTVTGVQTLTPSGPSAAPTSGPSSPSSPALMNNIPSTLVASAAGALFALLFNAL